jgi:two-component system, cell cycle sensor histidine kinase and response regulator CckA
VKRVGNPSCKPSERFRNDRLSAKTLYGIINQHNGYITCYSEPETGTTFRIYLPLIKAIVEDQASLDIPPLPSGTETILLCEDDMDVRIAAHEVLTGAGDTVIEAVNGEDALVKFSGQGANKVHLLITDVVMPRKNGKELYEEIKKLQPDIKVLFISGYPADHITGKGILETGMNFIPKPFLSHDLLNKVREVLDK